MKPYFTLLMLWLATLSLTANGQSSQSAGPVPLPTPTTVPHQNPDYREADRQPTMAPGGRNRIFRGKSIRQPYDYALPYRSFQAENVMQYPANGVQFGLSPDGRWIIVRPNNSGINATDPMLREGLDAPQLHKSFSIIRQ